MTVYPDYRFDMGKVRRKGRPEEDDILLSVPSRNALVWLVATTGERGPVLSGYASIGDSVRRVVTEGSNDPSEMCRKALIMASAMTGLGIYQGRDGGEGPTHMNRAVMLDAMSGAGRGAQAPALRTPEVMTDQEMRSLRSVEGRLVTKAGVAETGVTSPIDGFTTINVSRVLGARAARAGFKGAPSFDGVDVEAARASLSGVTSPSLHEVMWFGESAPVPANVHERDGELFQTDDEGVEKRWDPIEDRRRRAAASAPLLAGIIASDIEVSGVVDRNGPVFNAIRDLTGLSKGALKSLRSVTSSGPDLPVPSGPGLLAERPFTLSDAIREISALPPEWCPSSDAEWEDFRTVMSSVVIPLRDQLGIDHEPVLRGQLKKMGGWSGLRRTLANAADIGDPTGEALRDLTRGVVETVSMAGNDVLMPAIFEASGGEGVEVDEAFSEDLGKASMAMLVSMAPQKGSVYARLFSAHRAFVPRRNLLVGARSLTGGEEVAVERDFPMVRGKGVVFTASNGVKFRQLESFSDMNRHGDMQNNCLNYGFTKHAAETMRNAFFEVSDPYFDHETMSETRELSDVSTLRFYIGRTIQQVSIGGEKMFLEGDASVIGVSEFATTGGNFHSQPQPKRSHIDAAREFIASFSPEEADRLLQVSEACQAEVRKNGSVIANQHEIGEVYDGRGNNSADFWAGLSGVQMNAEAIDAVWKDWASHVLSGANPEDRRSIGSVPEVAALFAARSLSVPGPRTVPDEANDIEP